MIEEVEVSEETARDDLPEEDSMPPAPRGIDGESRVVAERSGADTSFPERPLLADPDNERRSTAENGDGNGGDEASEKRAPEPEVGPAS
ncbi:hypothetical protein [Streptosporangium sp. 'caverna']|uniref:hypothetical protein n=1 Tax=Streptosporangium sp. 'caverna' TaxID=2202249 RepID=UPI000D7D3D8F|nr:hypothetical protein [Streptosporangium sp. 'caverna']AWS44727.1 hypothetical protein DKM19_28770 [Streptosporangium sp. 'caverna']